MQKENDNLATHSRKVENGDIVDALWPKIQDPRLKIQKIQDSRFKFTDLPYSFED